ncbi:MAG: 3'(2'),5'-bisphosphate nucleotidase CysQ, partial [Verrucomicrobia bacterium]|nr:3'(2'),5'-bisphosphate nucleotidase CysQ [Verrucomicrobiota bacterium]
SDPSLFAPDAFPGEFWLVDPLDGTKEFLKQSGEFTVNIALIRDRRPVLGVVHAPAIGLTYWADDGGLAHRRRGSGPAEVIRARAPQRGRLTAVASRDHAGPRVEAWLRGHPDAQTTSMGSSLKFCLVAEGAADLYLRDLPTMEWDTAAAHAVLAAAGGTVWTLDGSPLRYGKPGLRNPGFAALVDRAIYFDEFSSPSSSSIP